MKNALLFLTLLCPALFSCNQTKTKNHQQAEQRNTEAAKADSVVYQSQALTIIKLTDHTYQHISYLDTDTFGKVPCNGMFVINEGEGIVFDTPTHSENAKELIIFIRSELKSKITALIPTHFHEDCIGGINEFDTQGIPAFVGTRTIKLLTDNNYNFKTPINAFNDSLNLKLGNQAVVVHFLGEGHTQDNLVGYFPLDHVLFGGCLIKSVGAGKGNLEDANVQQWPATVAKVKRKFPEADLIVPGHGKTGNTALLDYTIQLFETNNQ
ncbi:MAG: subclass B1 metallo-beta-lactamase [Bacteroidota bacterium]|jgi:metallo-beta-lactamase class B|nr:subclass B1 metallo-beta-lactamase [Bacteroidota bacterium]